MGPGTIKCIRYSLFVVYAEMMALWCVWGVGVGGGGLNQWGGGGVKSVGGGGIERSKI